MNRIFVRNPGGNILILGQDLINQKSHFTCVDYVTNNPDLFMRRLRWSLVDL